MKLVRVIKNKVHYTGKVYDLEVEDAHSFVADNKLVHNSQCSTRIATGIGVPNLTAVHEVYLSLKDNPTAIIVADGGIKYSGDVVKYLAAGAKMCMLGSVFSKAQESAGWELDHDNNKTRKFYRGQASKEFQQSNANKQKPKYVEGVQSNKAISFEDAVPALDIVENFEAGLRSAISYLGISSINELTPENVEFRKISASSYIEGTPHGEGNK